jgi:hypothetical protein
MHRLGYSVISILPAEGKADDADPWFSRSSHPLAKLLTSPVERRSSPSFSSDISNYWYWDAANDNVTVSHPEISSPGSSTASTGRVRRDPARAVKFSPEGSSRDLLVFTEASIKLKPICYVLQ